MMHSMETGGSGGSSIRGSRNTGTEAEREGCRLRREANSNSFSFEWCRTRHGHVDNGRILLWPTR